VTTPGREKPQACWICGKPANSSEHAYKVRDLRRTLFKKGSGGAWMFAGERSGVIAGSKFPAVQI
jgi:hypothetical protein